MSSALASRDGASSVTAGTPKNGTKAASRVPKSMSGRLKKRVAAADRAHQRLAGLVAREDLGVAEAQAPARAAPRSSTASLWRW